jgi:hypothetical protein
MVKALASLLLFPERSLTDKTDKDVKRKRSIAAACSEKPGVLQRIFRVGDGAIGCREGGNRPEPLGMYDIGLV